MSAWLTNLTLRSEWLFSRLPRRAPKLLLGIARRVAAWMRRVGKGAGSPFCQPPVKASERRKQGQSGGLSFGYFSLPKQRKVTRLSVRPIGRIADWHLPVRAKNRDVFRETDIQIASQRESLSRQIRVNFAINQHNSPIC